MNWWIGRPPYVGRADSSPSSAGSWSGSVVALEAVRGCPWPKLLTCWRETTTMLRSETLPGRLHAVVLFRAAILDELESQQPATFAAWLSEQYGRDRPRRG